MTAWPSGRRTAAGLAVAVALVTVAARVVLAGPDTGTLGSILYVAVTGIALVRPVFLVVQLIVGQIMVVGLLTAAPGPSLWVAPIVIGVVLTAEFLGVAARLEGPLSRDPTDDIGRSALRSLLAGGVFVVVLAAGILPGPSGFIAITVAATGIAVLTFVVRRAF